MFVGKDFDPAEPGEQDLYSFDFSPRLAAGETCTAATWTVAPSGASLVGSAAYTSAGLTTQMISTASAGVYLVEATITTSASRTLKLNAHIPTVTPS